MAAAGSFPAFLRPLHTYLTSERDGALPALKAAGLIDFYNRRTKEAIYQPDYDVIRDTPLSKRNYQLLAGSVASSAAIPDSVGGIPLSDRVKKALTAGFDAAAAEGAALPMYTPTFVQAFFMAANPDVKAAMPQFETMATAAGVETDQVVVTYLIKTHLVDALDDRAPVVKGRLDFAAVQRAQEATLKQFFPKAFDPRDRAVSEIFREAQEAAKAAARAAARSGETTTAVELAAARARNDRYRSLLAQFTFIDAIPGCTGFCLRVLGDKMGMMTQAAEKRLIQRYRIERAKLLGLPAPDFAAEARARKEAEIEAILDGPVDMRALLDGGGAAAGADAADDDFAVPDEDLASFYGKPAAAAMGNPFDAVLAELKEVLQRRGA